MGERPDELRRDPLDPVGGARRDPDPMADPVGGPDDVREVGPDPTLGRGVGGGPVVHDVEVTRGRTRPARPEAERSGGSSTTVVGTIRRNPVPAALTGVGLGWLLVSARRQRTDRGARLYRRPYPPSDYPPAYDATYDYPPRYEESGASPGQTLGRARDRVGETASQAQDRAGQVAGRAQDRVGQLGDQARRAGGGFQRVLRENPLTGGALAVGLGAAVGLAIPETAKEHEVMGEARDNLVEKTQKKAQDAQEKVQRVAEEAQSAAQQEADNQGLTGR